MTEEDTMGLICDEFGAYIELERQKFDLAMGWAE
jgi:hypothetical protein